MIKKQEPYTLGEQKSQEAQISQGNGVDKKTLVEDDTKFLVDDILLSPKEEKDNHIEIPQHFFTEYTLDTTLYDGNKLDFEVFVEQRGSGRIDVEQINNEKNEKINVICENLGNNRVIKDELLNISSGGLLLLSNADIQRELGYVVNLKLKIRGELINVEGIIVNKIGTVNETGIKYGIKFLNLKPEHQLLINIILHSNDSVSIVNKTKK